MGKKIRMKWRKLDILQQNQDETSEEYQENVLDNLHPFLKVKNQKKNIRDVLFEFHLKFWNTACIVIPVRSLL